MKEYQESWKQIGQKCSMLKETVHFKEETIIFFRAALYQHAELFLKRDICKT